MIIIIAAAMPTPFAAVCTSGWAAKNPEQHPVF